MELDEDVRGEKFFKNALRMLKRKTIPALEVIDENTTGLTPDRWEALVYKEGTPNKKGIRAAGGSYGIGKNAPYAASKLGLVCYSTRYSGKHRVEEFIARCKMVAHESPIKNGEYLQHIGFGTSEPLSGRYFPPVRGYAIHKAFRLPENGSGIYIVGFTEDGWERAARISIASNFFVAIHERQLRVDVNGELITNETLNDVKFNNESRRHYYNIVKSLRKPHRIKNEFGVFDLKVEVGDESMDNKVAYVNRRGMMITDEKKFKQNPFHPRLGESGRFMAVIQAADDDTDERVRKMEPPTHESIEYERLEEDSERVRTKEQLRDIQRQITEHISKHLNIENLESSTELSELSSILPFYSDEDSTGTGGNKGTLTNLGKIDHRKVAVPISRQGGTQSKSGNDKNEGDDRENEEEGDSTGKNKGKKKKDAGKSKNVVNIQQVRIMRHDDALRVALTPRVSKKISFVIKPAGEERKQEDDIQITSAKMLSDSSEAMKPILRNNIVTVGGARRGQRMILDLFVGNDTQYTAYNLEEHQGGRKKQ